MRITGAAEVGTYALRFGFSDGHATGIYSFEWLRRICPRDLEGADEAGRPIDP